MKLISISLLIVLLSMQVSFAQSSSSIGQVEQDAKRDAKLDFSLINWIFAGYACNIFGVAYAYFVNPQIPTSRMIGKSPVYVETYSLVFKQSVKRKRTIAASAGCIAGTLMSSFVYFWLLP